MSAEMACAYCGSPMGRRRPVATEAVCWRCWVQLYGRLARHGKECALVERAVPEEVGVMTERGSARRDVEVLRRWFPEADIVEPTNWLPHAEVPGGIHVEVLFQGDAAVALIERHRRADGSTCEGIVRIRPTGHDLEVWTVEQEEPLTLSPSILCRTCGHHGWIREGRWVTS